MDGKGGMTYQFRTGSGRLYERHSFFQDVFLKIGVSEENAQKDACMIEHTISEETYQRFQKMFSFYYNKEMECIKK